jgi:predicted porin
MRLSSLLLLLGSASAALAANPSPQAAVESKLNLSQSVGAQRKAQSYGNLPKVEGENLGELYPGENRDLGDQFIMMPVAPRTYFEAGADSQFYFTTNALLEEKGKSQSNILLSTAFFNIAPPAWDLGPGKLSLRAGYREQMYNYSLDSTQSGLNDLDFLVGTVTLNARYAFGDGWTASLGTDYNRYLSAENDLTEFYVEVLPQWGIEKSFSFDDRNSLTLAYFGAWHLTHTDPLPAPNINDRTDSIFLVTTTHQLCENVVFQPYYRYQHSHYWKNRDRNDSYNTFGVALTYLFNDWSSVRVFTSYECRDTNDNTIPDYNKWDTGAGLSIAVKF